MFSDLFFTKISRQLHNDTCRLCHVTPIHSHQLICDNCTQIYEIRKPTPLHHPQNSPIYAACTLNPALKKILYPFKFYNRRDSLSALLALLVTYWESLPHVTQQGPPSSVQVTAIPSRWSNNHLAPLLHGFSNHIGGTTTPDLLYWNRITESQHTLKNRHQRFNNVAHSLSVGLKPIPSTTPTGVNADINTDNPLPNPTEGEPKKDPPMILPNTSCIIVLDDITTTGATLIEAHRALAQYLTDSEQSPIPIIGLALGYVERGD